MANKTTRGPTRPTHTRGFTKPEYEAKMGMEELLEVMERLLKDPPPNLPGMAKRIAAGLDRFSAAMDKKGIECKCDPPKGASGFDPRATTSAEKWLCTCKAKKRKRRT